MEFELPSIQSIVSRIQHESYELYGMDFDQVTTIEEIKRRLADQGISYSDFIKCFLIPRLTSYSYDRHFDHNAEYYQRSETFEHETFDSFGAALHVQRIWKKYSDVIHHFPYCPKNLSPPNLILRSAPIGDLSSRIIISPDKTDVAIITDTSFFDVAKCICDMLSTVSAEERDGRVRVVPSPYIGERYQKIYSENTPTPDVITPIFSITTSQSFKIDYPVIPTNHSELTASNIMLDGLYSFLLGHEYAHFFQIFKDYPKPDIGKLRLENKEAMKTEWKKNYAGRFDWPDDQEIADRFVKQTMEVYADYTSIDLVMSLCQIQHPNKHPDLERYSFMYFYSMGIWIGFYIILFRDRITYLFEKGAHWDHTNMPFLAGHYSLQNVLSKSEHPCVFSRITSIVDWVRESQLLKNLGVPRETIEAVERSLETVSSYFDFCWAMSDVARIQTEPSIQHLSPRIRYMLSKNNQVNF